MEKRTCLECGAPLRGRADQKFCDDQCRSAFNNRKFRGSYSQIRKVNRMLKKNRTILSELNPDGKTTIKKNELIRKGFNFSYHTHSQTTRTGRIYYYCYEQGFLKLNNEKYLLIKEKE